MIACGRTLRDFLLVIGFVVVAGAIAPSASARAEPANAAVTVDTAAGYARLVFTLDDQIDASVTMTGSVLVISFSQPVFIAAEPIASHAADYVAAARRDPDGRAIRLALARKVTVNSVSAGKKFFVDLLPDTWSGEPPGLPQDVIAELSRRAREADRLERMARQNALQKKPEPVRVRVATQPTFTRYVFDIPPQTTVSADRSADGLALTFDSPIAFDVADAEAALPAAVAAIKTEVRQDSSVVRFSFSNKVDLRTFRDGASYNVDVVDVEEGQAQEPDHATDKAAEPAANLEAGPREKTAVQSAPSKPEPAAATATEKSKAAAPAALGAAPAPAPAPPRAAPAQPDASQAQPTPAAPGQSAIAPAAPPAVDAPRSPDAPVPKPSPDSAKAAPTEAKPDKAVAVAVARQGPNLRLSFPFMTPTAVAVFNRADTLWIVFDSAAAIDLSALKGEAAGAIRGAEFSRDADADVVRIRLDHPRLSSIVPEGAGWAITVGDAVVEPSRALDIARNMIGPDRSSIAVAFEEPHQVHRLHDPEVGDDLLVVTGFAPARGFVGEQDFIEFHALASTQGIAIEPVADDIAVTLGRDKVIVSRPGGLTLSSSLQGVQRGTVLHPATFDGQLWDFNQNAAFSEQLAKLIAAAAEVPARKRLLPRLDLARFYIARAMYPEAKGVLDLALAEEHSAAEDVSANVLRAIAEVMMDRPGDALRDLSNPAIGDQHDAPLWRALAYARQGKWRQARDAFKTAESAVATLPIELQRVVLKSETHAAIEAGDFAAAAAHLNDLETVGVPRELQPGISVLIGRLNEGMGRKEDALASYQMAADSWDRPAAAEARLREVALRYQLGELKAADVISELETLTTIWRGDETEIEALAMLARLYVEEGRYRDSFYIMRSAVAAHPDSDLTRRIQEEAAATFETVFLGGKGDALPPIDALALFYDFRDLTPIGRRGDEMIRRLADRLMAVDLLDQAAELLQYQIDNRLQGAARAQVATRLAVIYLMNRKPDRALAVLRATRTADLANELRNQRLLLEARALSDLGRHALALEVIANLDGREAIRLRADILWAARRWAQSAEQVELYYGDRWKEWQPLNDVERADVLRAAVGYALGEDALGLARFRDKYAAKMATTPDGHAFEVVSAPLGTNGEKFRDIARAAASVDTLEGFLHDMQARYPDASALPSANAPATNVPLSSASPDTQPAPPPPRRAAGRTALR